MRKFATATVAFWCVALASGQSDGAWAQVAGDASQPLIPKTAADKADMPDATRIAAARRLMETTGSAREFETVMPRVLAELQQSFEKRAPQNARDVAEVMQAVAGKFASKQDSLLNEIAAHFARTLSTEDMTAVSGFFASPAGKRYVAAVPALMSGAVSAGQEWTKKVAEEMRKEAEAELKKRGVPL